MSSTAYAKKSVTIPVSVLQDAEEHMENGNLSKYVTEALQDRIAHDNVSALAREISERSGYWPTQDAIDQAAKELGFK
jgi:HAMP domain-containing protein